MGAHAMSEIPILSELSPNVMLGIGVIVFLAVLGLLALFTRYFSLWIHCKMTRAGIGFVNLVMMSLRKVNPSLIVRCKIMGVQAGLTKT